MPSHKLRCKDKAFPYIFQEKKGFFKRLVEGLSKTRDNIVTGFDSIFMGYSSIDDDFYEELEETLVKESTSSHVHSND